MGVRVIWLILLIDSIYKLLPEFILLPVHEVESPVGISYSWTRNNNDMSSFNRPSLIHGTHATVFYLLRLTFRGSAIEMIEEI